MDVRALLLEACERSRVSQAELSRRAGLSSPSALSAWSSGRVSPTVASLNRVLAASGLRLRASLEPLLADLDARVDQVLEGTVTLDLAALDSFTARAGKELRWPVEHEDGEVTYSTGLIRWAFDGATALALQGYAFPQEWVEICLVFDAAAQSWLTKGLMLSTVAGRRSFWSLTLEGAQQFLGAGPLVGALGTLAVRPVAELPRVVRVLPEGSDRVYPAVAPDAVEQAHPALGEVLARIRARRATERQ